MSIELTSRTKLCDYYRLFFLNLVHSLNVFAILKGALLVGLEGHFLLYNIFGFIVATSALHVLLNGVADNEFVKAWVL